MPISTNFPIPDEYEEFGIEELLDRWGMSLQQLQGYVYNSDMLFGLTLWGRKAADKKFRVFLDGFEGTQMLTATEIHDEILRLFGIDTHSTLLGGHPQLGVAGSYASDLLGEECQAVHLVRYGSWESLHFMFEDASTCSYPLEDQLISNGLMIGVIHDCTYHDLVVSRDEVYRIERESEGWLAPYPNNCIRYDMRGSREAYFNQQGARYCEWQPPEGWTQSTSVRGAVKLTKQPNKMLRPDERDYLLATIGALSTLLAEKSAKYKHGGKPNASNIHSDVVAQLGSLGIDAKGHSHKALSERVRQGIEALKNL